jgi:hypothetical protein
MSGPISSPISIPISTQDLARIRQTFFLGLARQPLAAPVQLQSLLAAAPEREPALAVLAIAGQRQRFARPAGHRHNGTPEAARRLHEDRRPILPGGARRLLMRVANGADKATADAVISTAVRRVQRAGFRLHPFDLPRLIGHIKGDARCLGLAERAYLALADVSGKSETSSLLHTEITAENWTQFPKAHRVAFLREERRRDAAAGRALLESVLRSEPAAVRADLVAALDVGLGPDDWPLLQGLIVDRSENVRNTAAQLSARVPGTPGYQLAAQRLARALTGTGFPLAPQLAWLAGSVAGMASPELGRALLSSPTWRAIVEGLKEATTPAAMKDDGTLVWTAAVLPPELLPAFRDAIAALLPITTRPALDLADLALALDASKLAQEDADGKDQR